MIIKKTELWKKIVILARRWIQFWPTCHSPSFCCAALVFTTTLDDNKSGCVNKFLVYVLSAHYSNSLQCRQPMQWHNIGRKVSSLYPTYYCQAWSCHTALLLLSSVSQDVDGGLANEQRQRRRQLHRRADQLAARGTRILLLNTHMFWDNFASHLPSWSA